MNIAFYGKGGSGKTTLSALFATYADEQNYTVALLDVDVNSHTADILGLQDVPILSTPQHKADIRHYLAGENPKVQPSEFLNTTPPGQGSGRWTFDADNYLTKTYGRAFGSRSHLFTAGSYTPDQIGVDCHHGTQSIAENMISHIQYNEKDILVIDSVAGPDAFGTSLYLNDLLVFVVKPEREGIDVLRRFLCLAMSAGVEDRVVVIGNQASRPVEQDFLRREVSKDRLLGILPENDAIVERRLAGLPLGPESIDDASRDVFNQVLRRAQKLRQSPAKRQQAITALHKKVSGESWVAGSYRTGLDDQIDEDFCA